MLGSLTYLIQEIERFACSAQKGPRLGIVVEVDIFCLQKLCKTHQAKSGATFEGEIRKPILKGPPLVLICLLVTLV